MATRMLYNFRQRLAIKSLPKERGELYSNNRGFRELSDWGGSLRRKIRFSGLGVASLICLGLSALACGRPTLAQSPQPAASPEGAASGTQQQTDQQSAGSISGTVIDASGAAVAGARVTLMRDDLSTGQDVLSGSEGQFTFANISPGPFQLTIRATNFTGQTLSGILHPGEVHIVPPVTLTVASASTEVKVAAPRSDIAAAEVQVEEKQRVLGFIPNFYVSYVPNPVPLSPKQKFNLALRSTVDPITLILTGAIAGIEQAQNTFSGYGQGAQGYGKRFGATYANIVSGTFIGSAILPTVLKQDPRYFYRGTGSKRSRLLYALSNAFMCKGDNGRWQVNYSNIFGNLAAGGLSNAYYPANERGAGLAFENGAIGIGASAASGVLQEFVLRKLTPNVPDYNQVQP